MMERLVDEYLLERLDELHTKLNKVEAKLDKVINLLEPVHDHADWVARGRTYLNKIIPRSIADSTEHKEVFLPV